MKDFCLGDDLDLLIENGDLVVADSTVQDAHLTVLLPPGSWKQFPLVGVGAERMINGPLDGRLRRDIQLQLEGVGIRPRAIDIAGQQINVKL